MADSLVNDPTTLAPLPPTLHRGLVAVAVFGFLSFLTSLALLFRLGYRLVTWKRKSQARVNHVRTTTPRHQEAKNAPPDRTD